MTAPFVADAALRIEAPERPRQLGRRAAAALVALALEAGVFGVIWFEREPPIVAAPEEIPVEVVVEPPPPPPEPPPPPSPTPSAPELKSQEVEKPAFDAPREGKSDHDDEHVAEKEEPKAAPPPPEPSPSPSPSPQPSAAEATPQPEPTAAPPPALELPQASAEPEAPAPAEEPPAKPAPNPAVLAALPKTFDSVPDVDFGGAAMKSPVTGGGAKSTYLSQLYGLIVPRMRVPALAHAYGRRLTGVLGLQVDGRGRLIARFVVEGSGSTELDEAAMQAVAAAAKSFPPPPRREPIGMKFTYSVE